MALREAAAPSLDTLEAVLERQHLVFRAADVAKWLTPAEVRAEVLAGRWKMPYRNVYLAHNADPSPEQERRICLAAAPHGSALAGPIAASYDGLAGLGTEQVHIVVPAGSRRPRRVGLVCHLSTCLDTEDVHPLREPRRTRPARSVVDAASWSPNDRLARAVILAGVQQRLVRPADLQAALSRRGPCLRHALIVESIGDAEGGIASVPEHDFELMRRRHRLPEPTRQAVVRRADGRYYLDVWWARYRVGCEIHGVQHLDIANWDADLYRHNDLAAGGRQVLQFSSHAVRHQQRRVGDLVEAALRNAGWRGRRPL